MSNTRPEIHNLFYDYVFILRILYRIAGNFRKVKISRFLQFDPIHESLYAKPLISTHKRELSTRKLQI